MKGVGLQSRRKICIYKEEEVVVAGDGGTEGIQRRTKLFSCRRLPDSGCHKTRKMLAPGDDDDDAGMTWSTMSDHNH